MSKATGEAAIEKEINAKGAKDAIKTNLSISCASSVKKIL